MHSTPSSPFLAFLALPRLPRPSPPSSPSSPFLAFLAFPLSGIIFCVIWIQGGVCFLLWIAYGVFQNRRSESVRTWALSIPRERRITVAVAYLFVSVVQIFAVLTICLRLNGFTRSGMTPIVWLVVGAFGLLFVHGQTLATALLVATAQESVTATRLQSSSSQTIQEIEHDEAPSS